MSHKRRGVSAQRPYTTGKPDSVVLVVDPPPGEADVEAVVAVAPAQRQADPEPRTRDTGAIEPSPRKPRDWAEHHTTPSAPSETVISIGLPQIVGVVLTLAIVGLLVVALQVGIFNALLGELASLEATSLAFYLALTAVVLGVAVWYTFKHRGVLTGMTGSMVAMTFGMMVGLMVGGIFGATNGLFVGTVIGMVTGMAIGTATGCCEGLMGTLEGLMAGVMGGMMGAMTTLMLRYDNLNLFMPFYFAVFLLITGLILYLVRREAQGCPACQEHAAKASRKNTSRTTPAQGVPPSVFGVTTGLATFGLVFVMAFGPRSFFLSAGGTGDASAPSVSASPASPASTTSGASTTTQSAPASAAAPASSVSPAKLGPNEAAAVVNGEKIAMAEVQRRAELQFAFLRMTGQSDAGQRAQLDQFQASLATSMVEEWMLNQEAAKRGVTASDAEVTDFLANTVLKQLNTTEDRLKEEIGKAGLTMEYVREVLKRFVVADKFVKTVVLKDIEPAQQQSAYQTWYSSLQGKAQVVVNLKNDTTGGAAPQTSNRAGGEAKAEVKGNVQEINMRVSAGGYSPNVIRVKKGVPVRLNLTTDGTAGCARAFVFPAYNIQKVLPAKGTETIQFTPDRDGPLMFSCGMGMFRGQMIVEQG